MVVETKFNIGDSVYVAEPYEAYWANKEPYVVVNVVIRVSADHTIIIYYIKQGQSITSALERNLFSTYVECAKWCEEHN